MEIERGPHPKLLPLPELITSRLRLRRIVFGDAQDLFAGAGDARVPAFLDWDAHAAIADSNNFIASLQPLYEYGICPQWAIADRAHDRLMGVVSLSNVDQWHRRGDIGYWLAHRFWGNGYATEAVREVIRFAFEELSLLRVQGMHMPQNAASGRVLQKAGMRFEGVLRGYYFCKGEQRDMLVYSIVKGDKF